MASGPSSIWALDLGNNSLKALHLSNVNGVITVTGFDMVAHSKVLNGAGIKASEREELIAMSLREFVHRNDVSKEDVIISVPSQNSFARFVKLPPVEKKRIPEIVKFEAAQQIPFDINDVQWDWQMMSEPDATEQKVGIFAIKNDVVLAVLENFTRVGLPVKYVQMAPMAMYNFILYDRAELCKSDEQAVVVVDIGCENTDLVVCTKSTVWQRCIPMGGNAFTKSVADAFKLNFEKAEQLKRSAAMSKYSRQIFQAMKPVFTDLASEIQRSLGFYTSSNPGVKLTKVIAMGGGTKMRGLPQYLQQTLQIAVERPDAFSKLALGSDISAAKFHENVSDFGVVYGLALQGLGFGKLENNLLPRSIARSTMWANKAKYFTAAACLLLLVSLLSLGRTVFDKISYRNSEQTRQKIKNVINVATQAQSKVKAEKNKSANSEAIMQKSFDLLKYRDVIPALQQTIISVLPNEKNNSAQQSLYKAFSSGNVKKVKELPRNQRKQVFVTGMSIYFSNDIAMTQFGTKEFQKGIKRATAKKQEEEEDAPAKPVTPSSKSSASAAAVSKPKDAEGPMPGFIVTVVGFCPYKNVAELLDPAGVDKDPNKWGVITRLLHLNDVNSPFELYKKTEVSQFKLDIGTVSMDVDTPAGIGVLDTLKSGEFAGQTLLVDPMTREIICKVQEVDEYGKKKADKSGNPQLKINDHWFILNCKFKWKDAPKPVANG